MVLIRDFKTGKPPSHPCYEESINKIAIGNFSWTWNCHENFIDFSPTFFTHKKNYFTFSSSRQAQASELIFELLMYIWWPNSFNFMLTSPWFFAIWQIQMFVYKYSLLCLQKWRGETNVFKECTLHKKHNWVFVVDRVFSNL